MSKETLQEYYAFTVETAYQAGRLTLGYFLSEIEISFKSDASPVTIADRQAEVFIRNQIEKKFPEHTIIGEELGLSNQSGGNTRWIIDPIDGTKAFMRGVPLYGVLIGLEIDGIIEVGAAYLPALNEMVSAARGLGCWWNGRRAHVSSINKLEESVLTTTSLRSFYRHNRQKEFERLQNRCFHQAGWSDAYGYILVATGRAEIMLDPIMHIWDCAPFPVILSEAGGYFGDWRGNPTITGVEGLATSQILLDQVLGVLNQEE